MAFAQHFSCYIETPDLRATLQFNKPSFNKEKQKQVQRQVVWIESAWVQVYWN